MSQNNDMTNSRFPPTNTTLILFHTVFMDIKKLLPSGRSSVVVLNCHLPERSPLSAEGARIEAPRGWDLGERRKLSKRGPGQSHGHQRFWYILGLKNDVGDTQNIF